MNHLDRAEPFDDVVQLETSHRRSLLASPPSTFQGAERHTANDQALKGKEDDEHRDQRQAGHGEELAMPA